MKNIIILSCVLLVAASVGFTQEADSSNGTASALRPSSILISTGTTPLYSGLTGSGDWEHGNQTFNFTLNNDLGYGVYQWSFFDEHLSLGPSGGIFQNAWWWGPKIDISVGPLSILEWFGWVWGRPDNPGSDINFFYNNTAVTLDVWKLSANFTLLSFIDQETQHIVNLTFTQPIADRFDVFTGVTYVVNETYLYNIKEERQPLFGIGCTYDFRE